MDECSDTCKAMFGYVNNIGYSSKWCYCEARINGESMSCCDATVCPTTTTTTGEPMVDCYSLPSIDDCKQACEDEHGTSSSIFFQHRQQCSTMGMSCCDVDGARALSLLPAAMIAMSLLLARSF